MFVHTKGTHPMLFHTTSMTIILMGLGRCILYILPIFLKTIPAFNQGIDETRQIVDCRDGNGQVWKTLLASIQNATVEMKVCLVTSIIY